MMTAAEYADYQRDGYVVKRGVFTQEETARLRSHYMELRAADTYPGDFDGVDLTSNDPLKRFPRMIHMHRWDETSLNWLLDDRLRQALTELLGLEPYAVQTMIYFKPAGARGQALHQDQFYLRVQPGTCMAAWLALDSCDVENGCMQVVPGSDKLPLLCTKKADTTASFTDVTVPVPAGMPVVPVEMESGDVLFFNGNLIHGSYPNRSRDRFRRSLIGHYAVGDAQKIGGYYHPVLRFDGSTADLELNGSAGPCGIFRESDGKQEIEIILPDESEPALHE